MDEQRGLLNSTQAVTASTSTRTTHSHIAAPLTFLQRLPVRVDRKPCHPGNKDQQRAHTLFFFGMMLTERARSGVIFITISSQGRVEFKMVLMAKFRKPQSRLSRQEGRKEGRKGGSEGGRGGWMDAKGRLITPRTTYLTFLDYACMRESWKQL